MLPRSLAIDGLADDGFKGASRLFETNGSVTDLSGRAADVFGRTRNGRIVANSASRTRDDICTRFYWQWFSLDICGRLRIFVSSFETIVGLFVRPRNEA